MEERECCAKKKARTDEEKKKLLNRLSRIEGQVRGIKSMVENDGYCTDVVMQVSAVESALASFAKELLARHVKTCVVEDVLNGKTDTVDDLVETIGRLIR